MIIPGVVVGASRVEELVDRKRDGAGGHEVWIRVARM